MFDSREVLFSERRVCLYCIFHVPTLYDAAIDEADGAVGEGGEAFVVGDDDEGLTETVAKVEEELVEFLLVLGVEAAGGLVGKDDRGVVDEGAGDGDALLLSS